MSFFSFSFIFLLATFAIASKNISYNNPHFADGRNTIVMLFQWKFEDIGKECEHFLGPMGYGGVIVSPVTENRVIKNRPWFEVYEPICYNMGNRFGEKAKFKNMVEKCNDVGVRVYVDVVLNHMTANVQSAVGTAGTSAKPSDFSYPSVPYSYKDFHHPTCTLKNYKNATEVRNCELFDLRDLDQSRKDVRRKQVKFLNKLIGYGVAGFRIDAAKYMWPADLQKIYSQLDDLNCRYFSCYKRPYIFHDVMDYGNEAVSKYEYNHLGAVTEFLYGRKISNSMDGNNLLKSLISLNNYEKTSSLLPSEDALVFIDNYYTQRDDSNILTYKSPKKYKMALAFMLANSYGTSSIMSSFNFFNNDDGPPRHLDETIMSPIINSNNTCDPHWICEHRWRQIYNMVGFRNVANNTNISIWWDNGQNQIAFCRGNKGFIAINGDGYDLKKALFTCLEPGIYCDIISGNLVNNKCTGKVVVVGRDGRAYIEILLNQEDGVLAIHQGAKV